ncbi:hypothetical protein ONS95_005603 [Cadophora gregata]|uniref:uncharacterized protein n=1 Tax=Cadophora gregata TaxID=51156 RepID=UPI0026DD4ACA|nr:uncharacterized protein ONS95_005603 [Cadophora gregata]KAK0103590.1 hypothetical protein ONS95_005603 [Cadophora gregata]
MDNDGKKVQRLGDANIDDAGEFAADLHGNQLGGFGGLQIPMADMMSFDTIYEESFTSQEIAGVDEDMHWPETHCPSFSPTVSNEVYGMQMASLTNTSYVLADMNTGNFNFGPLDDGTFENDATFLFKDDCASPDTYLYSMSEAKTRSPLSAPGPQSLGIERDMRHDKSGNSRIMTAQSLEGGRNSFLEAPPTPIRASDFATGAPASQASPKPRSRNKTKTLPSLATQGPRYHCPTANCTRSYKRPFELIRHQHVHTNIRSYECRFVGCQRNGEGKGFARKDHLKQHLKLVHGVSA